jgi:hypothetical protein
MDQPQESPKDDIIYSHATLEFEEKTFKPWIIFPNENDNSLTCSFKLPLFNLSQMTITVIFMEKIFST